MWGRCIGQNSCKSAKHPRALNDYDEEAAYESYMNPEPGFQSGPGGSVVGTLPVSYYIQSPLGGGLRNCIVRLMDIESKKQAIFGTYFSEPPPEGGLDLVPIFEESFGTCGQPI